MFKKDAEDAYLINMVSKGQVSTEILIIIGLVLMVALVAIDFLYTQYGNISPATDSKSYWASQSPLAIKTFSASGNTLSLDISNSDSSSISISDISINGNSVFSTPTIIASGSDSKISGKLATPCGNGNFSYVNVVITYNKLDNVSVKETGTTPLSGTCS